MDKINQIDINFRKVDVFEVLAHKYKCPCFSVDYRRLGCALKLMGGTEVSKSRVFNPIIRISIDTIMTGFKSKNNQFALIYLLFIII